MSVKNIGYVDQELSSRRDIDFIPRDTEASFKLSRVVRLENVDRARYLLVKWHRLANLRLYFISADLSAINEVDRRSIEVPRIKLISILR